MYYPIGWRKVLKVDTKCNKERCKILSVQANHEKELYFILTTKSIHIWYPRPAAEIVCHRRSEESINKIGLNRTAVWKTDSSVIVVATERDQLLFYQVRRRLSKTSASTFLLPSSPDDDRIYRLKHDSKNNKKLLNGQLPPNPDAQVQIPALTMFSFGKLDLSSVGIACIMSAQEELIVGALNGQIYGVHWDGNVDDKFPWSLSSEVQKRSDYPVAIRFSSVLSGFALVFKSGRVGFMPSRIETGELLNGDSHTSTCDTNINYLASVNNAVCVEINHRHRLVAFGLNDSRIIVCNIGESNTSLVVNHTLEVANQTISNDGLTLGRVECIQYSPDNFAIAVFWRNGEFALWSVFGSSLFCSNQWRLDSSIEAPMKPVKVTSLAWGREGYSLWLCVVKDPEAVGHDLHKQTSLTSDDTLPIDPEKADSFCASLGDDLQEDILIMSLARCNLATSPHQTCSSDSLVLISEDKIYVGPSVPHEDKFDHWICINLPQTYLDSQYPIRYTTVNRSCKDLAIAGNRGLALYSIGSNKWTHFSKKPHGECFSVCGDLIWWNDYLLASCFNFDNESFELRAYNTNEKLDNRQVVIQRLVMEIIRMSIFENRLLVLYSDGTLGMFMLNLRRRPTLKKLRSNLTRSNSTASAVEQMAQDEQPSPDVNRSTRSDSVVSWSHPMKNPALLDKDLVLQISPIENLVISNLQANPFCISSIALTRLHFKNHRTDDSILLNACGKLFLLEREVPSDLSNSSPVSDMSSPDLGESSIDSRRLSKVELKVNSARLQSNSIHLASASLRNTISENDASSNVTFKAVSVIATNVEQFWISPEISMASEMSFFKRSLWFLRGGTANNKLQIWLPLLNDQNDPPTDLYVPDRIMLPIRCDIYPLAIRSSSVDVLEPDDAMVLGAECDVLYRDRRLFSQFPYATVKRQCRVYLHRILRELLLSQHLGYYAKKIAESCQSLPYFAHCFELLLHEVLEEESTSPVPLPDPMLPQVVKFIKQFPVFLETVVHCARKSELSMWSHLFDERAVGNPRRLFQECLDQHKYDTAASCLIILQSLDKNVVSSRMIKELIRLVKEDKKFSYLVEDLENFLARAELENLSLGGSPVNSTS